MVRNVACRVALGPVGALRSTTKGKGQSCFNDWPLFMPAMTYSAAHVWRGRPRPRSRPEVTHPLLEQGLAAMFIRHRQPPFCEWILFHGGRGARPTQDQRCPQTQSRSTITATDSRIFRKPMLICSSRSALARDKFYLTPPAILCW